MNLKPVILHIVRNEVFGDSRVLRSAQAVSDAFPNFDVKCFGYSSKDSIYVNNDSYEIILAKVNHWSWLPKFISRFLKYLGWHLQCVNKFKGQPIAVVHCHELTPLLIALHLKILTGCKIIYDAHELETECRTNKFDRYMKPVYKLVERLGISYSSKVITVSNSIMAWYKTRNPSADIVVVYNCPDVGTVKKSGNQATRTSGNIKYVYCGAMVPGRGIELYLDIFSKRPDDRLYFLGDGPLIEEVIKFSDKHNNIEYIGKVEPNYVVETLKFADVSLCLIENTTLTSRYCMPNKLFESVAAGLPVIVSDLPDMEQFVKENCVGWVVPYAPDKLFELIAGIDIHSVKKISANNTEISHRFMWASEKSKVVEIYYSILKNSVFAHETS